MDYQERAMLAKRRKHDSEVSSMINAIFTAVESKAEHPATIIEALGTALKCACMAYADLDKGEVRRKLEILRYLQKIGKELRETFKTPKNKA